MATSKEMNGSMGLMAYPVVTAMLLLECLTRVASAADAPMKPSTLSVIPKPLVIQESEGTFAIDAGTQIFVSPSSEEMRAVARYLSDLVAPATGFKISVKSPWFARKSGIVLRLDKSLKGLGDEGYKIGSTPKGVTITAAKPAGIFYGIQTLRQLLPPQIESRQKVDGVAWTVPCVTIEALTRVVSHL